MKKEKLNMISFNVNQNIKVRLTDLGYQYLADENNLFVGTLSSFEYKTLDHYKQQADKDGYTTFQMWSFMQQFGQVSYLGGPNYYDTTILIEI